MKLATVEEEYKKNEDELKKEYVDEIREWLKDQPHLPQIDEFFIIIFLHSNYYDLAATKITIEKYYTYRSTFDEFFTNRDVNEPALLQARDVMTVGLLPDKTKEGYDVLFIKLHNPDPSVSTFADNLKIYIMFIDMWLRRNGTHKGCVAVFDMEGVSWGHFWKIGLYTTQHYLKYFQEAMPVRFKSLVHFNIPSFFHKMLTMAKPFMKENILEMVNFSTTIDGTYHIIPQEVYPCDYPGGKGPSVQQLHETYNKDLEDYRDYFLEEEKTQRNDESLRHKKKSSWFFN